MPATHTKDELSHFLKPGTKLSIEMELGPQKSSSYSTTYLGCKENAYLIIDIPTRLVEDHAIRRLNNADVVIRGVSDTELGHVVAFKSSVLMHIVHPSPLLFVRLPKTFATKPVREFERYKLKMGCTIDHKGNLYTGSLIDFSLAGIGITTLIEPEFQVGDNVTIASALSVYVGKDNDCLIANIKKLTKGWIIGIKFEKPIAMTDQLKISLLEQYFLSSNQRLMLKEN
ncbi:flagellar brake protein [Vibrio sp. STUT-A11]|uniref:flagellar brake protein n=1 Tax=Vibrio sp. STUT-A11 TaxID=2976236 RepID=UPI002230482D|nr:flagellar brake protein [Vibrio sp. STUT-A11]BDR15784.1 pilus assembly protein PilZ [Vibrio sp. STUT-A11]